MPGMRDTPAVGVHPAPTLLSTPRSPLPPQVAHSGPSLTAGTLARVLAAAPEGMCVTDRNGIALTVNGALCRLLGLTEEQLVGHDFLDHALPEDLPALDEWFERLAAGDQSTSRIEHRMRAPGGDVWVEHSVGVVASDGGAPGLLVHLLCDRTAARRTQVDLAYRAEHDGQTGLANKESLRTRLGLRLGAPQSSSDAVGVLFCDIDHLKPINDRHGHLVGDQVISTVAARLAGAVRHQDIVARVGGDEFVIVLDHCRSVAELEVIARNVQQAASGHVPTAAGACQVSITVGAVLVEGTADADDALARADRALYAAKRSGRNRFGVLGLA